MFSGFLPPSPTTPFAKAGLRPCFCAGGLLLCRWPCFCAGGLVSPKNTRPFAKTLPSVAFLLMRACGNCVAARPYTNIARTISERLLSVRARGPPSPTTPFAKTLPSVAFLLMRACGNSVPAHPHSNKKPASVLESKLSGRWPVLFVRGWEGVTLPLPSFAPRRPSSPARSRWRI